MTHCWMWWCPPVCSISQIFWYSLTSGSFSGSKYPWLLHCGQLLPQVPFLFLEVRLEIKFRNLFPEPNPWCTFFWSLVHNAHTILNVENCDHLFCFVSRVCCTGLSGGTLFIVNDYHRTSHVCSKHLWAHFWHEKAHHWPPQGALSSCFALNRSIIMYCTYYDKCW